MKPSFVILNLRALRSHPTAFPTEGNFTDATSTSYRFAPDGSIRRIYPKGGKDRRWREEVQRRKEDR